MKKLLPVFLSLSFFSATAQTPFTTGNVVVLRVGTGSAALNSTATAVFLDEYNPAASTLAQTIPLSKVSDSTLTVSGSATSEGLITRSADNASLIVPGYYAPVGAAAVAGTASATTNRVIGIVNSGAAVDTTTRLADLYTGTNFRSATSSDGTNLWTAGATTGAAYTVKGNHTSTTIETAITNLRQINIFGGQLYFSTGSGATHGVFSLGSLPTSGPQTPVVLISTGSTASPYGFALSSTAAPVAGDYAYVADDRLPASGGGIQRWNYDGAVWTSPYTLTGTTGFRGLIVDFSGAPGPIIYATSTETSANKLYRFIDDPALAGLVTPTLIATAAANTVFRGVAFAPVAALVGLRFTSFTGVENSGAFLLKFTTANEENLSGFTVQKSTDGINFTDVASLAAHNNGNSASYNYSYSGSEKTTVYFRIKATDLSGHILFSDLVQRNNGKAGNTISVYPTLTTGSLTVHRSAKTGTAHIVILNEAGSVVARVPMTGGAVDQTVNVQQLAPGNYFLNYKDDVSGAVQTLRFVKQ